MSMLHSNVRRNPPPPISLLIIEDNTDQQMLIDQVMSQTLENVRPVWASTEAEALAYLKQCDQEHQPLPRLILLDLYLPEAQQGWQVLRAIRHQTQERWMPVVVLSHSSEPADITTAYELGANSYITKPLTFDDWLAYFSVLRTYWWNTVTLPRS